MLNDPIIEEIHAIRRELERECNNDLSLIVQRAMRQQKQRAASLTAARNTSCDASKDWVSTPRMSPSATA